MDILCLMIVMTSFKDARNLLLESFNDGVIDDDEFTLLYEGLEFQYRFRHDRRYRTQS